MKGTSIPMHPSQRDVYVDQLIHTNSAHYNIGGYIKLRGRLDTERFRKAVASAASVFDAFKLRFELDEEHFYCFKDSAFSELPLAESDFSSAADPSGEALKWMQDRFNEPFLIQKSGLLFEHALLKIEEDEYWFFGKYHHLITDGYGFIVFVRYVAETYRALTEGREPYVSYPSYIEEAEKTSRYFNSESFRADKAYWDQKVPGKPAKILNRKYTVSAQSVKTSSTAIYRMTASEEALLKDLSAQYQTGYQQITLAALQIYFGKITGHSELHFGIPVHKRTSRTQRNMVGMFSGILLFSGTYTPAQRIGELISETGATIRSDYRHQAYPIGSLSHDLRLNATDGYLHEISVNYEPLLFDINFGEGIKSEINRIANETDRNPLQICWREYGGDKGLELHVHYMLDYFNETEIDLLKDRILFLLQQFKNKPDGRLEEFNIIPPGEASILDSFNNTGREIPEGQTLVDLFEAQVLKSPNATAIVFDKEKITYKDLNRKANQIAHHLIKMGVGVESRVPVCVERGFMMVAGMLGILKAGAAYVPIDPEYPQERIDYMFSDCAASAVVCCKTGKARVQTDGKAAVYLDEDWPEISRESTENPVVKPGLSDLAYIIYTSGSQGKPKGVMIEHKNVFAFLCWCKNEFKTQTFDIVYAGTSICFDLSVFELFFPLCIGKKVRLLESGLYIARYLKDDRNVMTNSVPGVIQSLLLGGADLSNISAMNMAGEPVPVQVQQNLPYDHMIVRNLYGPSEDTTYSTCYHLTRENQILIGKPIDNTSVHIMGPGNTLMPVGVAGEICIGGAGLARGYLNSPELTDSKFIPNPFDARYGSRIYRTGDLGRWLTDGQLDFMGRIDNQVKIRGFRIELGEIESVLQQSGLCADAVVLAREDQYGDKRLVGYVVPETGYDRELAVQHLREKLPDYMIPGHWVELQSIPRTPNGKIDKKALPEPESDETISQTFEAPGNEIEQTLTLIWKDLLNLNEVSINDNFFDLGGHSLNAIQLTSRVHKILNIHLDVEAIFLHPTIKKLGKVLAIEKHLQFKEIEKLPVLDYYPLSHAQKRFWVLSHFSEGSEAYNNANTFLIEGNLNFEAFETAFLKVIDRHEILRTRFVEVQGEVYQQIVSTETIGFTIARRDLTELIDPEPYLREWVKNDSRQPFDLKKGPMLRATLFKTGIDRYVFAINLHHIISDGWSKHLFTREVFTYYKLQTEPGLPAPEPLRIQYKEYAAWHAGIMDGQGEFWRNLYWDSVPVLAFKTDFERPRVLSFFGAMLQYKLDASLTQSLRKKAVEYNMSLNNLLVSLYALLVARKSAQEDVVIGSLSSGRSHLDVENLIGVFINFLPVRLKPKTGMRIGEYLSASQNMLMQCYNHQDYPFDKMVEDCLKDRDVSRNPFFDTMVNFHLENTLSIKDASDLASEQIDNLSIKPYKNLQDDLFQSVLDFKLDVEPEGDSLALYLSYNTRLFMEKTMSQFLNQFAGVLHRFVHSEFLQLDELFPMEISSPDHEAGMAHSSVSKLPVYICASFVSEPIEEALKYWSNELDLGIETEFAPYSQIFQELLNTGGKFWRNKGMNVLLVRPEDWLRQQLHLSKREQLDFLQLTAREFEAALNLVASKLFTPCLVGIVPYSGHHSLDPEVAAALQAICRQTEQLIGGYSGFHSLSFTEIARLYDIDHMFDAQADAQGHMPFSEEFYVALGTYIARKIRAFRGPGYKVIALDCDNTLWKGICGEAGPLGVEIDEHYAALQDFMIQKSKEGFLLALCSKNNEADVWEVFDKNPGMKLKREHIAAWAVNWNPKSENLKQLATELNLGLNSFIFIDDTAFEVEQVSLACPEVNSIQIPEETETFRSFLEHVWEFDQFGVTEEDARRTRMYQIEKQRKEELSNYVSADDFIESLKIEVDIQPLKAADLDRAVQLCLRTNQFNLNGIRKTPEEIANYMQNEKGFHRMIQVKDRFGDYGIVGLILGTGNGVQLQLDTFVLSCRVLGRKVEEHILEYILGYCQNQKLTYLTCSYKQTAKNMPFKSFLDHTRWTTEGDAYRLKVKSLEQVGA